MPDEKALSINIEGRLSLYAGVYEIPEDMGTLHRLIDGIEDLDKYGFNRLAIDSTRDIILHHFESGGVVYISHDPKEPAEYSVRDVGSGRSMFEQLTRVIRENLDVISGEFGP